MCAPQVETLRDKISALSRDLATNQGDKCASSPQTASGSVQQGDVADVEHVMDASVQHEMLELRRELGAAQAALDAQMPMVSVSSHDVFSREAFNARCVSMPAWSVRHERCRG